MGVDRVEAGWTVRSLLRRVATAEPRYHALIDTGALVTGLGNEGVARALLAEGLGRWCEGVVFLDEHDEKASPFTVYITPICTAKGHELFQAIFTPHPACTRRVCGSVAFPVEHN